MADFTQTTQHDWLAMAERFYARLISCCEAIPARAWDRHTPYLGWTAHGVLAHMASAVPVNFRQVLERARRGDPTPPPEFDTFARNARAVETRRRTLVPELIRELKTEVASALDHFRGLSAEEWLAPAWFFVGPVRVRTLFLVLFGDDLFHERDLRIASGTWGGLDAQYMDHLADWFMREFRPAAFRPERAAGVNLTGHYRLRGAGEGEWTVRIDQGRCSVERGAPGKADFLLDSTTEDLIAAGLARTSPWVGRCARWASRAWPPDQRETTVAQATGRAAVASAILARRIRVSGNRSAAAVANRCFWHFWERTEQTEENISRPARSSYG